ncbi:MAG: hypothetical protein ACREPW_00585, partial [Candidatus Binataceae bacterium]
RLARRSPVTRVGPISAPLKRGRRRLSPAAGGAAVNGNGVAHRARSIADDRFGYDSSRLEIQNAALA